MVRGSHTYVAHLLTDSLPAETPSAGITGNKGFEAGSLGVIEDWGSIGVSFDSREYIVRFPTFENSLACPPVDVELPSLVLDRPILHFRAMQQSAFAHLEWFLYG